MPQVPRTWGPGREADSSAIPTSHTQALSSRPKRRDLRLLLLRPQPRDDSAPIQGAVVLIESKISTLKTPSPQSSVPEGQHENSPGRKSWVSGLYLPPESRRAGATHLFTIWSILSWIRAYFALDLFAFNSLYLRVWGEN